MTRTATITDLDRKIASLTALETEAREDGDESLAEVWRSMREKAEAKRKRLQRGAA